LRWHRPSPTSTPIKRASAGFQALLRKATERTIERVWAIAQGKVLDLETSCITTMTMNDWLLAFVQENGFGCGIIATAAGQVVARAGDVLNPSWDGLPKALFGDPEAIRGLHASFEGECLPQIYGQGRVRCVLNKAGKDLIVGLFDGSGRDDLELFDIGERACEMMSLGRR
jgi:hypothetical protein